MKFCVFSIILLGLCFSNALPTEKKSNIKQHIEEELDELNSLIQERKDNDNNENEDILSSIEEEQEELEVTMENQRKQFQQGKIAEGEEREEEGKEEEVNEEEEKEEKEREEEENEEEERIADKEQRQYREKMMMKARNSFLRKFHSLLIQRQQNKEPQNPSEEKENDDTATNIDNPENVDPDDSLENLLEGMTIEDNGKQHKVQGLHPEDSSKTFGDSLDSHRLIPQQQNQDNGAGRKRNFMNSAYLWHKAIIPYEIYGNLSSNTRDIIIDAIKDISDTTCVRWVPQSQAGSYGLNHDNYVRFISSIGCWSYVGNVADYTTNPDSIQEIGLQEPGCDNKATVVHEMLHAMGAHHEQSRADRDKYVEILYDNLRGGQNNINLRKASTDDHNPYDAESALQYSLYSFSANGQRTMQFKDHRLEFLANSAKGLEFYDIQDITDTYRCAGGCSNPPSCQNGGYVNFKCVCVCPDGLTGTTCTDTVSSSGCGGIINIGQGEVKYIQSPNYPSNYPTNLECTWLIKGTTNNLVRATVEYMDIAAGAACYHWLEYRYNLLGQTGPKRCGTHRKAGEEFWDSTTDELSNAMMIKFNSKQFSNQAAKTGFKLKLENIGTGCISNPCIYGTCTSPEGTSGYTCTCDAGITGQNCNIVSATATMRCTFEYGENCFLDNDKTDQFDWDFDNDGTPSKRTGPSRAYQGYQFVYTEASGKSANDKAVLVNNVMTLERSDKCLTFYYHMFGSTVGTLKVYTEGTGVTKSEVFSQSGNKGDVWIKGQLDIPAIDNLKIYFEGIRGSSYFGDIALDDIVLTPGTCANPITATTVTTTQATTTQATTTQTTTTQATTTKATTTKPTTTQATTTKTTTTQATTTRATTTQATTTQATTTRATTTQATSTQSTTTCATTTQATTTPTTTRATTTKATTTTSTQTCTFEQGTSCFMVDSTNDNFDWAIRSGYTPSVGTGPSGAFEGSFYSYIEVSSPLPNGAKATLVSSTVLTGSDYCLEFAYHKLGSTSMGDLVISTGVQYPVTEVLKIPGNQGNQWKEEAVDFKGGQNIKLFITANRGRTWKGDIAVDNLRLYTGFCSTGKNVCSVNPCLNGGSCTMDTSITGYTCSCTTGWTGLDCGLIDNTMETNLFCGFEDNENCVFQESKRADFTWDRTLGGTPSFGTGPSQAYEGTFYKYMEASSPRVYGEQAILSTESRQLASFTPYCLKFNYHMKGVPGSLSVGVGERDGQYSTIWTMSINQGDQWKEQQVQIDSSYYDPEIFIIATRGWSWQGDIAVDSISLKSETCQTASPCASSPCLNSGTCIDIDSTSFTCTCLNQWTGVTCETKVVIEFRCDFENGETCIFTDSTTDNFDWTRRSGSTPSYGTGPTGAYSGSYYLYTEVSYPRKKGQKAILTSENTQLIGSNYCLSMAYHMMGSPGPLIITAGERGSAKVIEAWKQTGNQGSAWQTVSINVPFYSNPVITIEGGRLNTWMGDTAIDNLVLKEGSCSQSSGR